MFPRLLKNACNKDDEKKNMSKISHLNHPTSQLNNFFIVAQNNKKLVPLKRMLHNLSNGIKNKQNGDR